MFRKLLIFTATAALAAFAFGGASIAGAQNNSTQTVTVIAAHTHFTTADVGSTGPSPGDELVFTATDVNLSGEVVGRLDGYCVFTQIDKRIR